LDNKMDLRPERQHFTAFCFVSSQASAVSQTVEVQI